MVIQINQEKLHTETNKSQVIDYKELYKLNSVFDLLKTINQATRILKKINLQTIKINASRPIDKANTCLNILLC
ncbi:hypothetical protein AYI87_12885 [Shewanella sp. KCT]|nr:hypothetical protein AYI87_12885 [Shewanella sp. KCT]